MSKIPHVIISCTNGQCHRNFSIHVDVCSSALLGRISLFVIPNGMGQDTCATVVLSFRQYFGPCPSTIVFRTKFRGTQLMVSSQYPYPLVQAHVDCETRTSLTVHFTATKIRGPQILRQLAIEVIWEVGGRKQLGKILSIVHTTEDGMVETVGCN